MNLKSISELSSTIKAIAKFARLHAGFVKAILDEKKAKESEKLELMRGVLLSQ